ncbi:MAG: CP12 domain-containing protein [Nodosilinea sp.]
MSATTAAFTAAAATSTATGRKPSLENQLRAALEHARRLTAMDESHSGEAAITWEMVEELQFAQRQQRATVQSAFARYCLANPNAPECRIYED